MRDRIVSVIRSLLPGLVLTAIVVAGAAAYVWHFGPLFGVWNWARVALASLVVLSMALVGIIELLRPPNPYSRTHPLYGLMDVAPHDSLESGGAWVGWLLPPLVVALVLLLYVLILG